MGVGSRGPCLTGYWFSRSGSSLEGICLPQIGQPCWDEGGVKFLNTVPHTEPDIHTYFHSVSFSLSVWKFLELLVSPRGAKFSS